MKNTLPQYWLTRPEFDLEPHRAEFERALQTALETGTTTLPNNIPVWSFLCWLCDERGYVAHGSGRDDIALLEPRQSIDVGWFGNRKAVYAASDGIWAMFFAIINRSEMPIMVNGAARVELETRLETLYFFGAGRRSIEARAYCNGWVYLLPNDGFELEPKGEMDGFQYQTCQCAHLGEVKPVFKVAVQPEDFPFLERIHAYDEDDFIARLERNPNGFPWVD